MMLGVHRRGRTLTLGHSIPRFLRAQELALPRLACDAFGSAIEGRRFIEEVDPSPESLLAEGGFCLCSFHVCGVQEVLRVPNSPGLLGVLPLQRHLLPGLLS